MFLVDILFKDFTYMIWWTKLYRKLLLLVLNPNSPQICAPILSLQAFTDNFQKAKDALAAQQAAQAAQDFSHRSTSLSR